MHLFDPRFSSQFDYGLFQQFRVEIEADGIDVSVLLCSKEIARPSQFEIMGRDSEAGAQIAELSDGGESLAGYPVRVSLEGMRR